MYFVFFPQHGHPSKIVSCVRSPFVRGGWQSCLTSPTPLNILSSNFDELGHQSLKELGGHAPSPP